MRKDRDWLVDAFGHPIADIRAKLIDEAWFGRHPTERAHGSDLGWLREERGRSPDAVAPERDPVADRSPPSARDEERGPDLDR